MQLLNESFNDIQFIATTHSPLVMSGCKDIPVNIISRGKIIEKKVYGWLAEDVYHEVMGLETSRPESIKHLIKKYENLYFASLNKKLSQSKKVAMNKIKKELLAVQGAEPITVNAELITLLKDLKKYRKK